jgi:hypothetical protein
MREKIRAGYWAGVSGPPEPVSEWRRAETSLDLNVVLGGV